MKYFNDRTWSVPRSTKYYHSAKQASVKYKSDFSHENKVSENNFELHQLQQGNDNETDTYVQMFNYQQMVNSNDEGDTCTDTYMDIEFDDLVSMHDLESENVLISEMETDSAIEFQDETLEEDSLDQLVNQGASMTFHDLAVLLITLKTAFNLSSIALSFVIKIISLALPVEQRGHLKSIKQLYDYFHSKDLNMKKHFYCDHCEFYIGSEQMDCPVCEKHSNSDKYFVQIPLEEELQKVIKRNWKNLQHRFNRKESNTGHISDVYDGALYKQHFSDGGFLTERNNISLLGNTDGVSIFKSSAFSVWPVYVVINELPPNLRFRRENRILCGLWLGKAKPNFTTFFKPFTEEIWKLCTEGFPVAVEEEMDKKICKAILLQMSCDSPAKCMFQGFMQFNAYYGCPYCLNPGEFNKDSHSHIYPFRQDSDNGFGESRTHEGTIEHARTARANIEEKKKKGNLLIKLAISQSVGDWWSP